MKPAARWLWFLPAPILCLAVFWRVPFVWFRMDDFAWLSLPSQVHSLGDLGQALFHPRAQGTVRVLSERAFFLVFSSIFGLHGPPYRAWVMGTWFVDLALIQLIGARITGSRAAGLLAALLWTVSAVLVQPLAWTSDYNQVLCAFFVLAAFYARLRWFESGERKWRLCEACAFLLGFGALEIMVVYPALALLYSVTQPQARKAWRSTLWMFVPAAIFAALQLFVIPKTSSPIYQLFFDARLPGNLWAYLHWTVGSHQPILMACALLGFAVWRLYRRDWLALFCWGWFLLLIAPVLPLANHVFEYYPTLPGVGLAWLAGWGMVAAWRNGWAARLAAIALAATYWSGSIAAVEEATAWHLTVSSRMRMLIRGIQDVLEEHPGSALVLHGVDEELFNAGFLDNPFRLLGAGPVYLAPGTGDEIVTREDLGGVAKFRISPEDALKLLGDGHARVLEVSMGEPQDVTRMYSAVLRAQLTAKRE